MKTKVNKGWYNQELRALNWQIGQEPIMIERTQKRISKVEKGGIDPAGCDLDKLKEILLNFENELGSAQKRKDVFLEAYESDDTIKSDWNGAINFIKSHKKDIQKAKHGTEFEYFAVPSLIGRLYGLRDRDDAVIDKLYFYIDTTLNS